MKKLIIIIAIALSFASCQKEKDYIEVEVYNIQQGNTSSMIYYTVTNNSDFDIKAKIIFYIDGTDQKNFTSDCKVFVANSGDYYYFNSTGFVYSVDYKVKLCEI